jgi:hypothetical protein
MVKYNLMYVTQFMLGLLCYTYYDFYVYTFL